MGCWIRTREIDGSLCLVVAVSSHESATFRGGRGHFCGRVVQLATRQGLLIFFSRPSRDGSDAVRVLQSLYKTRGSEQEATRREHRIVQRFRGGLVAKAHRLVYHSTLGLRVIIKKKKRREHVTSQEAAGSI